MGMSTQTMVIQNLKTNILADGVIDEDEVTELRKVIFDDGEVDREEAMVLFELNDKATKKHSSFDGLFVEAISKHVLDDDESPNVIDKNEADFLIGNILADGQVDNLERTLLANIKANATSIHESLQTKFVELNI